MRWYWIDRFVEFESGRRAVAIKNVSLAEEQVHDHFPGIPIMPQSLIIEGIAQTAGLLVGEHSGFRERVVLAKVSKAEFFRPVRPGDTLRYTAELQDIQHDGAICTATGHVGDELVVKADYVFAHLDHSSDQIRPLFDDKHLAIMLRGLGVYDVGKAADGSPLLPPPQFLAAEASVASS